MFIHLRSSLIDVTQKLYMICTQYILYILSINFIRNFHFHASTNDAQVCSCDFGCALHPGARSRRRRRGEEAYIIATSGSMLAVSMNSAGSGRSMPAAAEAMAKPKKSPSSSSASLSEDDSTSAAS